MSTPGLHAHQRPTGDHLHGVTEYALALHSSGSSLSCPPPRTDRPKEPLDIHTRFELWRQGRAGRSLITRSPTVLGWSAGGVVIGCSTWAGIAPSIGPLKQQPAVVCQSCWMRPSTELCDLVSGYFRFLRPATERSGGRVGRGESVDDAHGVALSSCSTAHAVRVCCSKKAQASAVASMSKVE